MIHVALPSPLSQEEIQNLPLSLLVKRMDDVRYAAHVERYEGVEFFFPRVAHLLGTTVGKAMDEKQARRLADTGFRYLLQMDMLSTSNGIMNQVVYGPNCSETQWHRPSHWLKAAVLDQYGIVASRIALECFFDLIHVADRGERMKGRSKFRAFRKWVVKPGNPYKYFIGHIIKALEFDREHRQREVHGTSRFAHSLLRLEVPDSAEQNISLRLSNILINVWQPLIQIMNGESPNSISVFEGTDGFADRYLYSDEDPESFDQFVQELIDSKLS